MTYQRARVVMVATNSSWAVDEFYLNTRVHLHLLNFLFLSFPDLFLSSWIYKSSSLPFLSRFDADNTQFRLALLSRDVNKQPEYNGELEFEREESTSETACDIKNRNRLTSSEKKSLIRKRLIPLGISLLILGAAVAVRFFVPLPSSYETASVGNDTLSGNMTGNVTKSPTLGNYKFMFQF